MWAIDYLSHSLTGNTNVESKQRILMLQGGGQLFCETCKDHVAGAVTPKEANSDWSVRFS